MSDFDLGYRKALADVKEYCEITRTDRDTPDEGRAELEFLASTINNLLASNKSAKECGELLAGGGLP